MKFRSIGDPVLYLSNPQGFPAENRRVYLDALKTINEDNLQDYGDPEISTRIAQYEMAFRMQSSVPELTDLSKEPKSVLELYGPDANKPGTFAIQLPAGETACRTRGPIYPALSSRLGPSRQTSRRPPKRCKETDQPSAALIQDLKQRGMLDDTLVVWGGEFGRTVYCQGRLTKDDYGRDHHPRCFTMWMAGGGMKPGITTGKRTISVTTSPVSRCTFTIYKRRFSIRWVSIT